MFRYWFGPYRKVELLRRTPSTMSSTWFPVRPRTNGDPPPWFVFWTKTPVTPWRASGVEWPPCSRPRAAVGPMVGMTATVLYSDPEASAITIDVHGVNLGGVVASAASLVWNGTRIRG